MDESSEGISAVVSTRIAREDDVYRAVSLVAYMIKDGAFSESDKQSIFISIMEVCRNVVDHAFGSGYLVCDLDERGFTFQCTDKGPGIHDLGKVLAGSYESSRGLGVGLASVKRLMDDLRINTSDEGTEVFGIKRERRRR